MKKLLLILVSGFLFHCAHQDLAPEAFKPLSAPEKRPTEVSIMTFNVENLFDTEHDPGKGDFTFLPLEAKKSAEAQAACAKNENKFYRRECLELDWTETKLKAKLQNLKKVILQVDHGKGPDILILAEVENTRVLERLNKEFLSEAGYSTQILLEGPDPRGIDNAVLSRLPAQGPPSLHSLPNGPHHLRGVLEVPLLLPDKTRLTILANHFPSQGQPHELRAKMSEYLSQLINEKAQSGAVIAAGDFNITQDEETSSGLFSKVLSKHAYVSHLIGCADCPGTHNYRGGWSFLDALIFSKDLGQTSVGPWQIIPESIEIPRSQALHLTTKGLPLRFDEESGTGVSDHFPLYARLSPRKPLNSK